ncbi:MAG: hypothetical protein JSS07_01915 [Proteobacteria bacterium]|nr:hypothetical protein [Pseudomonadota bacterium]
MKRGCSDNRFETEENIKRVKLNLETEQLLNHLHLISDQDKGFTLFNFAQNGDEQTVQAILNRFNTQINYGYKGWSFHEAAMNGHDNVVKVLLLSCANSIHPKQMFDASQSPKLKEDTIRMIQNFKG